MFKYIHVSIFFLWMFIVSQHKNYLGAMIVSGLGWVVCGVGDKFLGKWGARNRFSIICGLIVFAIIFFGLKI